MTESERNVLESYAGRYKKVIMLVRNLVPGFVFILGVFSAVFFYFTPNRGLVYISISTGIIFAVIFYLVIRRVTRFSYEFGPETESRGVFTDSEENSTNIVMLENRPVFVVDKDRFSDLFGREVRARIIEVRVSLGSRVNQYRRVQVLLSVENRSIADDPAA